MTTIMRTSYIAHVGTPYDRDEDPYTENDPRDFSVTVGASLYKSDIVTTTDYHSTVERDEDGTGYEDIDTEETSWWTEWRKNGHYTITEMLGILKTYVEADIALYKEQGRAFKSRGSLACGASLNIANLRQLHDDCSGWEVDDYTVEP